MGAKRTNLLQPGWENSYFSFVRDDNTKVSGRYAAWFVCKECSVQNSHRKPHLADISNVILEKIKHCKFCSAKLYAAGNRRILRHSKKERYYETIHGRAVRLYHSAKSRACRRKIPFEITQEWIVKQLEPGKCCVTGYQFDLSTRSDTRKNPLAPSLDQRCPKKGYTRKNCRVVVSWYNDMKGELTDQEALDILCNIPNFGERRWCL
jgi:hypothetical protein